MRVASQVAGIMALSAAIAFGFVYSAVNVYVNHCKG